MIKNIIEKRVSSSRDELEYYATNLIILVYEKRASNKQAPIQLPFVH